MSAPDIVMPASTPSTHPWSVMTRVIVALVLRETKTRFGQNKLGYLWAILEPVAYVAIFVLIREQIRAAVPFGVSLFLFILTGLLTFRIFVSISSRALSAITANKPLLGYPPVKPTDVIIARVLLESLTMFIVLIIFYAFLALTSDQKIIVHHEKWAGAVAAVFLLSAGIGTFNAVFVVIWPTWQRIWSLLRLPLLLLSGIFYVPSSLPPAAQEILWWNPVLHCTEWFRTATYISYDPLLDRGYVITFGLATMAVGLVLERLNRYRFRP